MRPTRAVAVTTVRRRRPDGRDVLTRVAVTLTLLLPAAVFAQVPRLGVPPGAHGAGIGAPPPAGTRPLAEQIHRRSRVPAGTLPPGAVGQPPMGAAGRPPIGAAGPPPLGAAGPPPLGAAGPPPINSTVTVPNPMRCAPGAHCPRVCDPRAGVPCDDQVPAGDQPPAGE